jgi:2-phosphosulfolactate phosphatase
VPDTVERVKTPLTPDTPTQQRYEVRLDWGREGLRSVAPGAGVIVVVDALTFTTAVELAVAGGLEVQPFDGRRAEAERAQVRGEFGAARLVGRRGAPGLTLAPSTVTDENVAAFGACRAVIPSRNGSRISARAARFGVPVVAASLRNRGAVARWILDYQRSLGRRVVVAIVAAGETRTDETVRFAVEDLLAAGAVVDALSTLGVDACSPEAAAACAAYTGLAGGIRHLITASVTAEHLIRDGEGDDIELAVQTDVSTTVPVLMPSLGDGIQGGIFTAARPAAWPAETSEDTVSLG